MAFKIASSGALISTSTAPARVRADERVFEHGVGLRRAAGGDAQHSNPQALQRVWVEARPVVGLVGVGVQRSPGRPDRSRR